MTNWCDGGGTCVHFAGKEYTWMYWAEQETEWEPKTDALFCVDLQKLAAGESGAAWKFPGASPWRSAYQVSSNGLYLSVIQENDNAQQRIVLCDMAAGTMAYYGQLPFRDQQGTLIWVNENTLHYFDVAEYWDYDAADYVYEIEQASFYEIRLEF
jgi:hypothetical protein